MLGCRDSCLCCERARAGESGARTGTRGPCALEPLPRTREGCAFKVQQDSHRTAGSKPGSPIPSECMGQLPSSLRLSVPLGEREPSCLPGLGVRAGDCGKATPAAPGDRDHRVRLVGGRGARACVAQAFKLSVEGSSRAADRRRWPWRSFIRCHTSWQMETPVSPPGCLKLDSFLGDPTRVGTAVRAPV